MREPPRIIWLQFHGDSEEPLLDGEEVYEVTWSENEIYARDVKYVMSNWVDRLEKIEAAAANLVNVKGRYHTEQAMKVLIDAVNIPHF